MAKTSAVWGIDIGHCALKALRCRPHEKDEHRLVVEAFDYIEYPKILTQPEADRETLVREALEEFASRNEVLGDRVAIAVPGQSGLARFIKLPPVESKKIPDIVKYEARQQIPFALEDVVWDYQPLVGSVDEGYALETEVGLFAMKRDQVARALKPLEEVGIQVDIIQLAPLSIYNFICFDRMQLDGNYDPANPPQSTVVISLGTDTTDLVITNGYRVWQRNIPIGGNHFTKALTKELKLTFAKAEHLKRNAMKAENPKAVFQAMRPVFSDLVAEIQRSIGFFTSNNRNAKLGSIVALGNPMKLPGLKRFLSQNLDQDVRVIDQFNGLVGGTATASPQYKENQLTFGVAYGLCVQALGDAQIRTNLLPDEILTARLVRAKKPWAAAAAAVLLVGLTVNYAMYYLSWNSADTTNPAMTAALKATKELESTTQQWDTQFNEITNHFDNVTKIGQSLQSNIDGRLQWLEFMKAFTAALPRDERPPDERKDTPEDVSIRNELHIERMDCEYVPDLAKWFDTVKPFYVPVNDPAAAPAAPPTANNANAAAAPPATDAAAAAGVTEAAANPVPAGAVGADGAPAAPAATAPIGPTGAGWVIEIQGHHFHNQLPNQGPGPNEGRNFVLNTFCRNLQLGEVELPDGANNALKKVPIASLGIGYPVIVKDEGINSAGIEYLPVPYDPATEQAGGGRMTFMQRGGMETDENAQVENWRLRRYDFTLQFCWSQKPRSARQQEPAKKDGPTAATAMRDVP